MQENKFLVYGLVDPRDGRLRYVGKSCSGFKRPKSHKNPSELSKKCPKASWIKSLLASSLMYEIVVLERCESSVETSTAEIFWIAYYRKRGFALTNMTDGGDGVSGIKQTPEHVAKRAAAQRNKIISEEHKARLRAFHTGKIVSAETRAKIGAASRGRVVSQETRAKLSAAGFRRYSSSTN